MPKYQFMPLNGERYLKSIDSILIQTFNYFEFIIVNDGRRIIQNLSTSL
jgi:hypothetical protein